MGASGAAAAVQMLAALFHIHGTALSKSYSTQYGSQTLTCTRTCIDAHRARESKKKQQKCNIPSGVRSLIGIPRMSQTETNFLQTKKKIIRCQIKRINHIKSQRYPI